MATIRKAPHSVDTRRILRFAAYGLMLGLTLHSVGFSDYHELHRMLVFDELRMFLAFAGAVLVIFVGMRFLARGYALPHRPVHRGTVPGALLFGMGWVLSGACPAVVFVQLGEGYWPALATGLGMLLGTAIYSALQGRVFRWSTGSCE